MRKFSRDLIEHLLEVGWALFLLYLFLACLALIFGRSVGYEITPWVCLGFALVVTAIFAVIILGNLLWLGFVGIFRRLFNRPK
ncbi:MAG: hypothetical protein FD174_2472 [Geobacteraceae bacterium]|nr:MAG: hypothetical protein FD174_2472 [Geobacteraceae bacterium]